MNDVAGARVQGGAGERGRKFVTAAEQNRNKNKSSTAAEKVFF